MQVMLELEPFFSRTIPPGWNILSAIFLKFNPHQKHYSTIEKEALALILALERFNVCFFQPDPRGQH